MAERPEAERTGAVRRILFSPVLRAVLVGLALFLLLFANEHERAGTGRLVHSDWLLLLLWLVPVFLLARKAAAAPGETPARRATRLAAPLILLGFALLFTFSGSVKHPWFFFLDWTPQTRPGFHCLDAGMLRLLLLTALLTPFVLADGKRMRLFPLVLLPVLQALCFGALLKTTGGAALYRDDHPSFLFRLWEFSETFPKLISYNPYWNGGVVNFVGTTSGVAAIGLPLWPLWRLAPIHEGYTYGVGILYILALPWLAVASLRILGAGRTAAWCAGILMLGVSRHFFLWMLHFGTVGAVFSSAFLLPVSACVFRAVQRRRRGPWLAAALVLSSFFLLQWPPGALIAAPIALSFLFSVRQWRTRTLWFLALCGVGVAALYTRPLLTILTRGDPLMAHVGRAGAADARSYWTADFLLGGFHYLLAHIQEGHPLLIFLGLGGLFALPHRRVRNWYVPILVCLALVTGWGPAVRPNLQLGRTAIPLFFVAVVPASVLAAKLLQTGGPRLAVARALLLAFLILGGWNVARLYAGDGVATYNVMPARFQELALRLRDLTPPGARVLFAGKCVHYYGRGHVAYLPRLAEREMMSCDYYAFPTDMVEYNYPPAAFRRPETKLADFMQLYNVACIVTYRPEWQEAFRRHPDDYEEIPEFEDIGISIFKVLREPSIFLKGSGTATATFNRIAVRLDDRDAEAVLKYNWAAQLSAPEPVKLYEFDAGDGVRLIGIRPNGRREFVIRYRSWL